MFFFQIGKLFSKARFRCRFTKKSWFLFGKISNFVSKNVFGNSEKNFEDFPISDRVPCQARFGWTVNQYFNWRDVPRFQVHRGFLKLGTPRWVISEKKTKLFSHACLAWSAGFLSVIFGILGKFRIGIGVQKNFRIFCSRWKRLSKNPKSWQL